MHELSNKIRLTKFLREFLGEEAPTFWEGKAVIPYGSFDFKLFEIESELWNWEAQIFYKGESVFSLKGNAFHEAFAEDIKETLQEVGHSYFPLWKDKVSEVCSYLDRKQGILMTPSSSWIYEGIESLDKSHKMSWTEDDPDEEFGVLTRILIVTTTKMEPVLILDSSLMNNKYSYSIGLDDDKYKKVIKDFFNEVEKHKK